jgi:hypothetical protein
MKMAIVPLDNDNLGYWVERMARLTPDTERRWGSLTAHRMITHLRVSLELSLEERETVRASNPLSRTRLFQWFIIEKMPWPKGLKAPDVLTPPPDGSFDDEMAALKSAMQRFAEAAKNTPDRVTENGGFGPMTLGRWTRFHGRHMRHHLDQFGIG